MIKKIISFLLISGGETQEDYGYDLFDYLAGNLTSDEFFASDYSSLRFKYREFANRERKQLKLN